LRHSWEYRAGVPDDNQGSRALLPSAAGYINSGDIAFSRLLNNNSSMIVGCFRQWDNRAEQLLHVSLQNSITVARLSYTYECEQRRKGQSAS